MALSIVDICSVLCFRGLIYIAANGPPAIYTDRFVVRVNTKESSLDFQPLPDSEL